MSKAMPQSMSIPEAGKYYLNLSRNGAYDAARRGIIPYVEVGKLKRVPTRLMERMLDTAGAPGEQKVQK